MEFKTAMEHYTSGTANDAERRYVEAEVEKYLLISEHLDTSWDQPLPDAEPPQAEMKKMRGKLRRRSILLVVTSIILVAALLVAAAPMLARQQSEAINSKIEENQQNQAALDAQYWDPRQASYCEDVTDLELALMAHTELFCPGMELRSVTVSHVGLGIYTLSIHSQKSPKAENYYFSGAVTEGTLSICDGYYDCRLPANAIAGAMYPYYPMSDAAIESTRENLAALPAYVKVRAAVSFPDDISMEELIDFSETDGLLVLWSGIRVNEEGQQMLPCGMDPFSGGLVVTGINDTYPAFCINGEAGTAENLIQHFKSLLRYSADQVENGTGIEARTDNGKSYYETALDYVEENGVKSYGCVVSASPQVLIALLDARIITQIYPMEAWIDV